MTLKKVGDDIRAQLKAAQARGILPTRGALRYEVRVSNSKKTGPAVNITINGYEGLIPDREEDGALKRWADAEGAFLIATVDKVAARDRYKAEDGSALLGGETRFGICIVSVSPIGVRHDTYSGS